MRSLFSLLAALTLLAVAAVSDVSKVEVKDLRNHPFSVDFPSGNRLRMQLRSGDIRIVGRDDNKIAVRLDGKNADHVQDLTVRFKRFDTESELRVFDGPRNDISVIIEIPKSSHLFVRMPFGDLTLEGIAGDKDVELHAGDLTIGVGNADDYSRVDTSVSAGDIDASPFGQSRGGLFRSFEKSGPGKFTLHAHVGAGDLTLH